VLAVTKTFIFFGGVLLHLRATGSVELAVLPPAAARVFSAYPTLAAGYTSALVGATTAGAALVATAGLGVVAVYAADTDSAGRDWGNRVRGSTTDPSVFVPTGFDRNTGLARGYWGTREERARSTAQPTVPGIANRVFEAASPTIWEGFRNVYASHPRSEPTSGRAAVPLPANPPVTEKPVVVTPTTPSPSLPTSTGGDYDDLGTGVVETDEVAPVKSTVPFVSGEFHTHLWQTRESKPRRSKAKGKGRVSNTLPAPSQSVAALKKRRR
jgi:hypothetical protein